MEHKGDSNINDSWSNWNNSKELEKEARGTRDLRNNCDHLDHRTTEIGLNTQKSPVELRRLAVAQTLVKNHQLLVIIMLHYQHGYP